MHARPDRWRWPWAVLAVAALATAAPARAANEKVAVEALRIGFDEQGNRFKVGTWTPVRVQLKAGPEGFAGTLAVSVPDDDGTETVFRRAVTVDPGALAWFTSYARPGSVDAEFEVRLYNEDGKQVGNGVRSGMLPTPVDGLTPDQILVATLGNPSGMDALRGMTGFGEKEGMYGGPALVASRMGVPDGLPGRWFGYDAADVVVIDADDQATLDALNAGKGEALKTWVRDGGHLVVAVGERWQAVKDSVLADLLPAEPAGRVAIDDLGGLETFAGSTKPVTDGTRPVTVTRLEGYEGRGGHALDSSATPLVVRGPYYFGRVTVVGLDVDRPPFAKWEDRGQFWVKALDLRRRSTEGNTPGAAFGGGAIYQSNVTDLSTVLHEAMEQFPGVTLVPFGWVAFFIFLYILLIGPGDYFFLKKVLKRMELTWVTFPTIVVTVSLLAYVAAYAVKGTTLRVNKVDALDVDQTTGLARGTTWLTLFSPQNRDYDVAIAPRPLGGAEPDGAPKGRTAAGAETLISFFGIPEKTYGGMNSRSQFSFSGSRYYYEPAERAESLKGVRVPIWSAKSFTARWVGPAEPVVDAELEALGADRLSGTVTNRLDRPMRNAILALGKRVYLLGDLAAGASVRVELKPDRTLVGYLEEKTRTVPGDQWNLRTAQISRPDLVLNLMFRDSAGARATMLPSNPLAYLDLSGQLALDRPMFVAEIDAPAVDLDLGASAPKAETRQTTLVRVILPLGGGSGEGNDSQ